MSGHPKDFSPKDPTLKAAKALQPETGVGNESLASPRVEEAIEVDAVAPELMTAEARSNIKICMEYTADEIIKSAQEWSQWTLCVLEHRKEPGLTKWNESLGKVLMEIEEFGDLIKKDLEKNGGNTAELVAQLTTHVKESRERARQFQDECVKINKPYEADIIEQMDVMFKNFDSFMRNAKNLRDGLDLLKMENEPIPSDDDDCDLDLDMEKRTKRRRRQQERRENNDSNQSHPTVEKPADLNCPTCGAHPSGVQPGSSAGTSGPSPAAPATEGSAENGIGQEQGSDVPLIAKNQPQMELQRASGIGSIPDPNIVEKPADSAPILPTDDDALALAMQSGSSAGTSGSSSAPPVTQPSEEADSNRALNGSNQKQENRKRRQPSAAANLNPESAKKRPLLAGHPNRGPTSNAEVPGITDTAAESQPGTSQRAQSSPSRPESPDSDEEMPEERRVVADQGYSLEPYEPRKAATAAMENIKKQRNGTSVTGSNKPAGQHPKTPSRQAQPATKSKKSKDERESEKYRNKRIAKLNKWNERDRTVAESFTHATDPKEKVLKLIPGGERFMPVWSIVEKTFFPQRDGQIFTASTKDQFSENLRVHGLKVVHLVENAKEVLGIQCPEISFQNMQDYFEMGVYKSFMDATGSYLYETLNAFAQEMTLREEEKEHIPLNIVSQEESQNKRIKIVLPDVVMEHSVIDIIKRVAQQMIRDSTDEEAAKIQARVKNLMAVDKYVIFSMKESFMDVHIDLSATAVYYFVWDGRKVFYAAPATDKNVTLYEELESKRMDVNFDEWMGDETWIASKLEDVRRVEINAGQMALLPAGWIHFVYTPRDSVVFGGNFLTTDNLPLVFRVTKLEERSLQAGRLDQSNLFQSLYETLFFYIDCMIYTNNEDELIKIAAPLISGLKDHTTDTKWYTVDERKALLKKLKKYVQNTN